MAKLQWLIQLRWLAILFFFICAAPLYMLNFLNRDTLPIYVSAIGFLLMFNLFSHLFWGEIRHRVQPVLVCFHLTLDLLILTLLLVLSKGLANPLVLLLIINASLGGILITSRLSWPYLFLVHTVLFVLQISELLNSQLSDLTGFFTTAAASHFIILAAWLMMRSLGSHIEKQQNMYIQSRLLTEKQDRLRALGALAAGFSHEFASPLNTIKIRLERIARLHSNEETQEALLAVQTCENIISQMSTAQLDSREPQARMVNIGELIHDIVDCWSQDNPKTEVKIVSQNMGALPIAPLNLAQVLMNLLDNANEAAPGKLIEVSMQKNHHSYRLSVQDQGPGFPSWILSRIGEPFITTKPQGTGLGLYVTELFAQSLGGTLKLINLTPNPGAQVLLEWPLAEGTEGV